MIWLLLLQFFVAVFIAAFIWLMATVPHPEWLWNVVLGPLGTGIVVTLFKVVVED